MQHSQTQPGNESNWRTSAPSRLTVGSLFAGIGGWDVGLEWAGLGIAWQVEKDPRCLEVLKKHWPDVPKFTDVRECGKHNLAAVDVIAGGFPCQQISSAGRREGIGTEDSPTERSGLWFEYLRIIRELRPRWVLIENVYRLLHTNDGDTVLSGMEREGYACWPLVLEADDLGAPHVRKRAWIICHQTGAEGTYGPEALMAGEWVVQPECQSRMAEARQVWNELKHELRGGSAHPHPAKVTTPTATEILEKNWSCKWFQHLSGRWRKRGGSMSWAQELAVRAAVQGNSKLEPTAELCEKFMGFPVGWTDLGNASPEAARYARLTQGVRAMPDWRERQSELGNAVVPQIAMMIGGFIQQWESRDVFSARGGIRELKEDGMIERPPEQDPPDIQTGEKISRVETKYESLEVEGTKRAYQELNSALEGMANTVVSTLEEIVPYLARMQALLSQRGAGRKKVLKKAGLPRWTHWAKSYEKKFGCTLRTIQLRIKLHREGRRQGASGGARADGSSTGRRSASKAPARIDGRQQEWLLKSHAAANKLVAALKSGSDWKGPLGEYERATRPPAKLKARLNAHSPEPDWKRALASLVDTLEQCGDKLPIPAIKGMQVAQALLEGRPAADSQRETGPRLTVCPPAGRPEEDEPDASGPTSVQPPLRKTA